MLDHRTATRLGSGLLAAVALIAIPFAICAGIIGRGEDTWAHYRSGGIFVTESPSFSADCRTLYFSSPETGHGDIYGLDLLNKSYARLTSSPECEISPRSLPKSRRVLFHRESHGRRHIWSMAADGSAQQQLTSGDYLDDLIAVSSDEERLVFARSPLTFGLGRTVTCFLITLDDPDADPTETGTFASISASGDRVAYNPKGALEDIWIWDLNNDTRRLVGRGNVALISPNGQMVLAAREPTGGLRENNSDLVLLDVAGGDQRVLAQGHSAAFLPDGPGIVFLKGYSNDVYLMRLDDPSPLKEIVLPVS